MAQLSDYVVFADERLAQRFAHGSVPMETLQEAYIDGALDIPDLGAFLDAREKLVDFTITKGHVRFLVTRMLPEWLVHSKAQDQRIVRDHYDRGDDFFQAFLGDSMIYTSGIFHDDTESLEEAQRNKMNLVCQKLRLEPGQSLLDIGCGWGTLVAHAAAERGADVTGITTTYGERWYRLWNLFLGWSWRIALQGSSECFQAIAHKNLDGFNRRFSLGNGLPLTPGQGQTPN